MQPCPASTLGYRRRPERRTRESPINWDIFLSWQFGMTLVAAVAIGIWQMRSVRRSREKRGESGHVGHPPAQSGPAGDETPPPR